MRSVVVSPAPSAKEIAQPVGMPLIAEYAKRFGVYDDLPPYSQFQNAVATREEKNIT